MVEAMALHLSGVMDPRRQSFMPIFEGCAALEDTDTHILTCENFISMTYIFRDLYQKLI